MPGMNDFHAFDSTSSNSDNGAGAVCFGSFVLWIIGGVILVLYVLGELFC